MDSVVDTWNTIGEFVRGNPDEAGTIDDLINRASHSGSDIANASEEIDFELSDEVRDEFWDLEQQLAHDTSGEGSAGPTTNRASRPGSQSIVDSRFYERAQSINGNLLAAEAAAQRAQRNYQNALQQQANRDQVQRAHNEWVRQQAIFNSLQQMSNLFGNNQSGGGRGYTPGPYRPGSNPTRGTRRGGNARGFRDLLQPVPDPNRAQQLQDAFGNRNR